MNINTPPAKEKIVNLDGIGTWQWIKWFDNTYKFIRGLMDFFDWNTTLSAPVYREGRMYWDADEATIAVYVDATGVSAHFGRERIIKVVNKTGATLSQNKVVYLSGAQGNRPTVALADANLITSHSTVGLIVADIADNAEGYAIVGGLLKGFNTSAFTAGDVLYLSTTAGDVTKTKPTAPDHTIRIGWALNSTNNGSILVSISLGGETRDLHDVSGTASTVTGQILVWNNTAGYYEPSMQAYGEMYGTNFSETITVASANTAYELTAGLTGGIQNRVAIGGAHYLQVTDAGKYICNWSMAIESASAADEVEAGVMVNGTASDKGTSHTTVASASKSSAVAGSLMLELSANDQVSLFVRNHTAGRDITVEHASMLLDRKIGS